MIHVFQDETPKITFCKESGTAGSVEERGNAVLPENLEMIWSSRVLRHVLLLSFAALVHSSAYADPITSRAVLKETLNGRGSLETFEGYRLSNQAERLSCGMIDSTTLCNGQGPNLIASGIAMNIDQWNPIDYYGSSSQEVSSSTGRLRVDFVQPVHASGVDLRAYTSFPTVASVSLFGQDHVTPLGAIRGIELPATGTPTFIGWQYAGGIGRVEFSQLTLGGEGTYSPIADNLEFGPSPVPEPSTMLLVGTGALAFGRTLMKGRWRRLAAPRRQG